jgi:hypothetical protein
MLISFQFFFINLIRSLSFSIYNKKIDLKNFFCFLLLKNKMYSSFDDDNIRPPDESFSETLVEDTRSDFEKQIDEAIYISMREMSEQQNNIKQYEERLIKNYLEETNRRKDIFKEFLINLNKISKFDKEVREIYDIIDPIIDSYCGQYIEFCELDLETYNKIFDTLKKIRNNQLAFDTITRIILKEI